MIEPGLEMEVVWRHGAPLTAGNACLAGQEKAVTA